MNEESRLATLRLGLLLLAGVSALAIIPAWRLPRYRPHEVPAPDAHEEGPMVESSPSDRGSS